MKASFQVTYEGSKEKRNGTRAFYVACHSVKNALIENGNAYGKNAFLEFKVKSSDEFIYEYNVAGTIQVENWRTERTYSVKKWYNPISWFKEDVTEYTYHKKVYCTIEYNDLKSYIDRWPDNYYRFTYNSNPKYSIDVEHQGQESFTSEIGRVALPKNSIWKYVTQSKKVDKQYTFDGGISSNMYIREIHDKINLIKLSIPSGTFYVGQKVPITAKFDDNIKIDSSIKLTMTDGTVLEPIETGTKGNSCTFLYQVPDIPSGNIPNIQKLSLNGTQSFTEDTLMIEGQERSNTTFNLELLSNNAPDKIMIGNAKCYLRNYKDASFTDIEAYIDDGVPANQWVTEVIRIDQGANGAYRKWIQSNCEPIDKLDLDTRIDLKSGKEV